MNWAVLKFLSQSQIPHTVWNPKILYSVYNSMLCVPIMSQINPFQSPLYLPTCRYPDRPWYALECNTEKKKINEFSNTFLNLLPLTIMYGRELTVLISLTVSKPSTSFTPSSNPLAVWCYRLLHQSQFLENLGDRSNGIWWYTTGNLKSKYALYSIPSNLYV